MMNKLIEDLINAKAFAAVVANDPTDTCSTGADGDARRWLQEAQTAMCDHILAVAATTGDFEPTRPAFEAFVTRNQQDQGFGPPDFHRDGGIYYIDSVEAGWVGWKGALTNQQELPQ
jgi:hypothetical protein